MSSCYIISHLPFLESTIPDSSKPKTVKSSTVLYIDEDTELEASIWSYQPTGLSPDGILAFVTARLSRNGTAPPVLEVTNMTPFQDNDHLPPVQPSIFAIGTVTKTFPSDKSFILSGQEFIVCFSVFFQNLYVS
jgi:hypothetical protein